MIIPDFVRKSVVFLGLGKPYEEPETVGTAFLLFRNVPGMTGFEFYYFVTAVHLIRDALPNEVVWIRVNPINETKEAIWKDVGSPNNWFIRHEKEVGFVDVAVLPFDRDEIRKYDLIPLDFEVISREEDRIRYGVGPGEDIFITGWFKPHSGRRNVPIVRVGNIAAMPGEFIDTDHGLMEAYLIEARSIGGISGSPVFVNMGGLRATGTFSPTFQLLGLVYGHFDEDPKKRSRRGAPNPQQGPTEQVNMGISVVVPGEKIRLVIGQPDIRVPEEKQLAAAQKSLRSGGDKEKAPADG